MTEFSNYLENNNNENFTHLRSKCFFSVPTWLQGGLQTEDQLASLHIEEANLPIGEGCDQVGRFTAHQVY